MTIDLFTPFLPNCPSLWPNEITRRSRADSTTRSGTGEWLAESSRPGLDLGCFVLDQGARLRAVWQAISAARALVLEDLETVVDVLHLGMHGPFGTYLPAQPAGDAEALLDPDLHDSSPSAEPPSARVGCEAQGLSKKSNTSSIGFWSSGVSAYTSIWYLPSIKCIISSASWLRN